MHLQGLNYLQTVIVIRDKPLLSHNNSNQINSNQIRRKPQPKSTTAQPLILQLQKQLVEVKTVAITA